MRIARLIERVPPEPGGKEIHAAQLTRALSDLGVDQHVFCRSGQQISPSIRQTRITGGAVSGIHLLAAFCMRAVVAIRVAHAARPFDLVHAHGDFLEALAAAAVGRELGIPAVLTIHGGLSDVAWHDMLRLGTFSAMETVFAVSPVVAHRMAELGVSARLVSLPSAVRPDFFRDAHSPPRARTIVSVGRLAPVKGLETLIAAADAMRDHADLRWVVAAGGRDEYARRLRTAIDERPNMSCVEIDAPGELAALLADAHVFVLPSVECERQQEGVPTALLEAIAARVPVIASETGGVPDVLEGGRAGLLVAPGEVAALVAAIEQTLADPKSAAARAELAATNGWARDWPELAERVMHEYSAAAERHRTDAVVLALPWFDVGGAEYFVLAIALGLDAQGVRTCVAGAPGKLVDELSTTEFAPLHRLRSPSDAVWNTVAMAGAFARLRPRAINSHHIPTALCARVARWVVRPRPRHVLTIHTTEDPRMAPVVGVVGAYLVDGVLLVAEAVRSEFSRFSPPHRRHRFAVVHAGVEMPEPAPIQERTVGVLARLVHRKGHDVLLRAWALVRVDERSTGWRLELWGDGPERLAIERQIERLGLGDSVTIRGSVMNAAARVGEFPVVALPSLREGLPLSLMEAMAAGCAVIASDLPGTRELVDTAGILVAEGDEDALAAGLLELFSDEERRAALGSAARARVVERFGRQRMIAAYGEALLGQREPRAGLRAIRGRSRS